MKTFLTIGQVAERSGETRDTIRYYERLGLLPRAPRTPAGYRQYGTGVLNRLALIRNAQRFGFPLRQIATFLAVRDGGGQPCHDVRAAAERMLDAVERQMRELAAAREQMKSTLESWDARLAAAPRGRPAFLLDSLSAVPARRVSRAARLRT
jgi:DNA-binding transcriptional MerR regulator